MKKDGINFNKDYSQIKNKLKYEENVTKELNTNILMNDNEVHCIQNGIINISYSFIIFFNIFQLKFQQKFQQFQLQVI